MQSETGPEFSAVSQESKKPSEHNDVMATNLRMEDVDPPSRELALRRS